MMHTLGGPLARRPSDHHGGTIGSAQNHPRDTGGVRPGIPIRLVASGSWQAGSDSHPSALVSRSARLVTAPVIRDSGKAAARGARREVRRSACSTEPPADVPIWTPSTGGCEMPGLSLTQTERRPCSSPVVATSRRSTRTAGPIDWPVLASDLPPGPVRDLVAGAASIRALLAARDRRGPLDDVRCAQRRQARPSPGSAGPRASWSARRRSRSGCRSRSTDAGLCRRGQGRHVVGWSQPGCDVRGRGALARRGGGGRRRRPAVEPTVRHACRPAGRPRRRGRAAGLPGRDGGSVDGVVADIDTEYLHDFRVAVRRTRSVLEAARRRAADRGSRGRPGSSAGWATSPRRPATSTCTCSAWTGCGRRSADPTTSTRSRRTSASRRRTRPSAELAAALDARLAMPASRRRWRAALAEVIAAPDQLRRDRRRAGPGPDRAHLPPGRAAGEGDQDRSRRRPRCTHCARSARSCAI